MSDYEIEPVPGLPEPLPAGETILWQGAPQWTALARHSFHLRELAAYFAILLVWYIASSAAGGGHFGEIGFATARLLAVSGFAVGILALYAGLLKWTTLFTVTNRRIVIRSGIALPTVVNIPFSAIESAGLKTFRDGSGNILLGLAADQRIAYLILWPNVRMTRLSKVEPLLRGIGKAQGAARILANALAAAASLPPVAIGETAWEPVGNHRPETAAA